MTKLEAYGIFIVVKTVETKRGTFVLNEFNRWRGRRLRDWGYSLLPT